MKTVYYNKWNKFDWDILYNKVFIYNRKMHCIGVFNIKTWE